MIFFLSLINAHQVLLCCIRLGEFISLWKPSILLKNVQQKTYIAVIMLTQT